MLQITYFHSYCSIIDEKAGGAFGNAYGKDIPNKLTEDWHNENFKETWSLSTVVVEELIVSCDNSNQTEIRKPAVYIM